MQVLLVELELQDFGFGEVRKTWEPRKKRTHGTEPEDKPAGQGSLRTDRFETAFMGAWAY